MTTPGSERDEYVSWFFVVVVARRMHFVKTFILFYFISCGTAFSLIYISLGFVVEVSQIKLIKPIIEQSK